MNDPSPAVLLRAAAEKIRKLAKAVSAPDERDQVFHADGVDIMQGRMPGMYDVATTQTPELALYIAAMHPGVGAGLVKWLEYTAELTESVTRKRPDAATAEAVWLAPAIEVARQIVGAES